MTGCLPTKVQLSTKHVNVDLFCPFCHNFYETISHILMECNFSQSCWNLATPNVHHGSNNDFGNWFSMILESNFVDVSVDAAMVSWSIWNAQNDAFWKSKQRTAAGVVLSARSTLQQWTAARVEKQGPLLVLSPHSGQVLWKKPVLHTTKVNVDGAIFADERRYGFGCIAHGADGKMIEAISGSMFGVVGPEIAEVIGVKEALSWIKRKGWSKVEIETNSLVVVQAVTGSVQMPSQFGFLVQDCRHLLSCISHVSLHFVKRSANRAAHCLARASCYHSDRIVSEHTAPLELKSIVDVECL